MALKMHPSLMMPAGQWLKEAFIQSGEMKVGEMAQKIGVTRQSFSAVLNGRSAMTPTLAVRLERHLGISATTLMHMQVDYELSQEREKLDP